MLSEEEKMEMLADANNESRRDSFRFSRKNNTSVMSFDEYLTFLDDVQKALCPSKNLGGITLTELNKL